MHNRRSVGVKPKERWGRNEKLVRMETIIETRMMKSEKKAVTLQRLYVCVREKGFLKPTQRRLTIMDEERIRNEEHIRSEEQ